MIKLLNKIKIGVNPREGLHNPRRSESRQSRIHKVKPKVLFQRFFGRNAPYLPPLQATAGRLPALQAHLSPCSLNNSLSGHPQVAQGKQRDQLRRVLGQPFVAHLGKTELALDNAKRVLYLGAHAGLELLGLVQQAAPRRLLVQRPALARTHGHVPVHAGGFRSLAGSLVTRIGKHHGLLTMQQAVALGHIVDVGCGTDDSVHQARICIHTNVRLHAKVPLIALLGLVHLRVTLSAAVLGGARRRNQGGINHRAGLEQQAARGQFGVDAVQDLWGQAVDFQEMAKAQDGGLIGDAGHARVQVSKLPVQGYVMQALFHGRVGVPKELLQQMDAQHHLKRKGRAPVLAYRGVRRNQSQQTIPRRNGIHLGQQLTLSRDFDGQLKSGGGEAYSFHHHLGARGLRG